MSRLGLSNYTGHSERVADTYAQAGPTPLAASPGMLRTCAEAAQAQRDFSADIWMRLESAMAKVRGPAPTTANEKRERVSEHTLVSALNEAQNDTHRALEAIDNLVSELHRLLD